MSISRDTGKDASNFTSSGTSIAVSAPGGTYDAGKLLVSCVLVGDAPTTLTNPSGFSTAVSRDQFGVVGIRIAYKENSAGSETGTTWIKSGGATDLYAATFQFSGALTSGAFDASVAADTNGSQLATLATGSTGTTTQADELLITMLGTAGAMTSPSAATAGAAIITVGSSIKLAVAQRTLSSTGTFSDTWNWTNNNFANVAIATFKAAAAVASSSKLGLLGVG